jgi:hypothetical protein
MGSTGGGTGGYGLVGVCVDAGDEVNEVAGWESENGVRVRVELTYQGVVDCTVGRQEA